MRRVVIRRQDNTQGKEETIKPVVNPDPQPKQTTYNNAVKLQPDTHLEIFGRITKIVRRKRGEDTVFQVLTPNTGYLLTCASQYFSPIMEGDAIFARGFVDDTGKLVNLSRPPFISPGNDKDSVVQSSMIAIGNKEKVLLILSEVSKMLNLGEDLATRLDYLSVSHHKLGHKMLTHLVQDTLKPDAGKLLTWWYKKRCLRRLYLLDFTNTEINASGYDPIELFKVALDNPYRIPSISLEKCELIFLRLSKTPPPEDKYCGEIMRKVKSFLDQKWTYVPRGVIEKTYPDFKTYEKHLIADYGIYACREYVALERIVQLEQEVANFIRFLLAQNKQELTPEEVVLLNSCFDDHRCDEDQRKAIRGILENNITVVTGGAGTGKTTILRALVSYLEVKEVNFLLTSFTGKAVARIKEVVTQSKPSTLHRLIGNRPAEGEDESTFNYVVVDETSMLETKLFHDFIRRFPQDKYKYKVVFIGDLNQLPPIGWGCFFQEVIKSGKIPAYYLTKCHRTEGVGILTNAQLLLDGCFFEPTPDFQLCFGKTPLQIIEEHQLSVESVRILAPFVETVGDQNKLLQEFFSKGLPYVEDAKGRQWFLRDRVMMTKNNYTINVMNGQEGFVAFFDPNEEGINVAFKEGEVHFFAFRSDDLEKVLTYYPPALGRYLDLDTCEEITPSASKRKKFWSEQYRICSNNKILFYNMQRELEDANKAKGSDEDSREFPPVDHLIHSYALTVHKAQGSEWDYVIVVLPKRAKISDFVTRNLLYTAITRAKKGVFCLGDKQSWLRGILNLDKDPKQLLATFIKN